MKVRTISTRFRVMAGVLAIAVLGLASHTRVSEPADRGQALKLVPAAQPRGIEFSAGDRFSYVPYERADMMSDASATANFVVNYSGFTPQAQAAFQFAVNIWADTVVSSVPIVVNASFSALGGNTLGQAGPNFFWRDFVGAPRANTFFADAIADKLSGLNRNPGQPDIEAEFSSTPPVPWYFGLDARPPAGSVDFVSVVLHELGHGLGFIGSGTIDGSGLGVWGLGSPARPISYDRHVYHGSGRAYISNPTPSAQAAGDIRSNNLFFASPAFGDGRISTPARLYAPSTFQSGSTYSHLDESTYPAGNANALMTPSIGSAEANHNPGPITREIFSDIGWGATGSGPAPGGAPGKPTVTQAQVSGGLLSITWTTGVGATPTAHRLDFFLGGALAASVNIGAATSTAIPIPPGTVGSFTVTVTPFNGSTPGPASDPFGFTIGSSCATASITSLQGGVSGGIASVSWTGSNAASFIVQAGSTLGGTNFFPPTNVGGANSASAPVGPGFSAFVRVTGVNACGQAGGSRDVFIQ